MLLESDYPWLQRTKETKGHKRSKIICIGISVPYMDSEIRGTSE